MDTKTKSWDELTFADNFLFCKILESEPEICRQLIELLLDIKIDHLEIPHSEKTMRELPGAKGVRFDVYTKDDNRIFDLEIQTTDTKNLPERTRYYQSIIDMDNLQKGENYKNLKDSYIIFLCLTDIFNKALPVYHFENLCLQDKGIKLNDRAYKVFFNAESCDKMKDGRKRDFFKFLKGEKAVSGFVKSLEEKVEFAKKNMEWRRNYMTWEQEILYQRSEAFEEGAQQTAIANAKNALAIGLNAEQVSQITKLPLEQVLALKEEVTLQTEN
ncbi:MAG: Rpn family recombination-promoting nuclease/putative transposase [Treponema sp.]|nr:Rpn family recombination-promoting nuclease/putative transposase [Treponema sp.]